MKKLKLKKLTIARLDDDAMMEALAGQVTFLVTTCNTLWAACCPPNIVAD